MKRIKQILYLIFLLDIFSLNTNAVSHKIGEIITNADGTKGIVLWINPDNTSGWMVAINDATSSITFGNGTCDYYYSTTTEGIDDWNGFNNTKSIRRNQNNITNTAVGILNFNNGWYLPAEGQLLIIGSEQSIIQKAGGTRLETNQSYWSSSRNNIVVGLGLRIENNRSYPQILIGNTTTAAVRAVKDFSNIQYDTTLTYQWNTGETTPTIQVTPSQTTTYTVTATTKSGCAVSAEKTIIVKDASVKKEIYDTICSGETYTDYGFQKAASGTYDTTLVSESNTCSIPLTLHLAVMPKYNDTITDKICQSNLYNKNGFDFIPDTAGLFYQTRILRSQYGCDSTLTLKLSVNPSYAETKQDTIMQGESYIKNGFNLSARPLAGTETHALQLNTNKGCDSIVTLTLVVLPKIKVNTHTIMADSVCQHKSYSRNGFSLPEQDIAGNKTYTRLITPYDTLTLNLYVLDTKNIVINKTICNEGSYKFGTETYDKSGTHSLTMTTKEGCDSIITLNLQKRDKIEKEVKDTICSDGSYAFGGEDRKSSGNYPVHFTTSEGCDSLVTLELTKLPDYCKSKNITICEGESYEFNGESRSAIGTYYHKLRSTFGCDSTETLNLFVNPKRKTSFEMHIDHNSIYNFNGRQLTEAGEYTDTLKTIEGCDSIVSLRLSVGSNKNVIDSLNIPDGFSPNDDGVNDTFNINGIENFPESELIILNRWGNKLFDSKPAKPWDGKNHEGGSLGKDLPVGTYFYILKLGNGYNTKKGYLYLNK